MFLVEPEKHISKAITCFSFYLVSLKEESGKEMKNKPVLSDFADVALCVMA